MSAQHTQGRLSIDRDDPFALLDGMPRLVATTDVLREPHGRDPAECVANARRLCACWNACEGLSDEALEAGVVKLVLEAAMNPVLADLARSRAIAGQYRVLYLAALQVLAEVAGETGMPRRAVLDRLGAATRSLSGDPVAQDAVTDMLRTEREVPTTDAAAAGRGGDSALHGGSPG